MGFASHIYVATDFSEASAVAIAAAAELANACGAKVTLVHAFDPDPLVPPNAVPNPGAYAGRIATEMEAAIRQSLTETRTQAPLSSVADVAVLVERGPSAAMAICEAARRDGADLIVVATHGRTGLSRLLIGSVAERVVRHAHCPVLTVRPLES